MVDATKPSKYIETSRRALLATPPLLPFLVTAAGITKA